MFAYLYSLHVKERMHFIPDVRQEPSIITQTALHMIQQLQISAYIALSTLTFLIAGHLPAFAQAPVDYNDVIVVINENSDVSKEIGEYFARQRSVPERNIARISVPAKETINDEEFQDLRSQVESFITGNDMTDTINYIVLTKGVPLRVNRPLENGENNQTTRRASVDNELTLILGSFTEIIGGQGWATHNYSTLVAHFDRQLIPLYLVTRLDAYTKEDVFAMIDNSGPNTLVNKDSAIFVMDRDPRPIDGTFDQSQVAAGQLLANRGWRILLNSDSVYITEQKNVLGYASWGSNDHYDQYTSEHAIPRNTWSPGALAETFVSTSGRSFQPGTSYGQSLIADWIAEGAVGAKGYVFEPFTIALALPHTLFDRYTDETQDTAFNLAESFYMASRTLSWMEVVLGDPKTSVISQIPPVPSPRISREITICSGDSVPLRPTNLSRGAHNWFRGDSAEIASYNLPYDNRHPLWIADGKLYAPGFDTAGIQTYTYVNTNISGTGFAEITVTVSQLDEPEFSVSADTVRPGEEIVFTDLSGESFESRWDFGDGNFYHSDGSSTSVTHTYDQIGIYTVRFTIFNNGCIKSTVRTIVVTNTTHVPDYPETLLAGLNVHPNPTAGSVTIEAQLPRSANVIVRLYDPSGQLLRTETLKTTGMLHHALNMEGYASGIYLVEITVGEQRFARSVVRQ